MYRSRLILVGAAVVGAACAHRKPSTAAVPDSVRVAAEHRARMAAMQTWVDSASRALGLAPMDSARTTAVGGEVVGDSGSAPRRRDTTAARDSAKRTSATPPR
jgi:hypothetical protein